MRKFRLAVFVALIYVGQVSAVMDLALVHGTGNQTNAAADYWQWGVVNSIRQGLSNQNNYVVINCNFEKYMWDSAAAGCLVGQLTTFINSKGITDLVINTHSNGGNVIRWIMSNPTWDSRYPSIISKIRWVNALAPFSKGTPLADAVMQGTVFESASIHRLVTDKSIASDLQGYINRPDGSVLGELNFNQNKNGSYSARLPAIGAQGLAQGLWEVHVFAKSNDKGIEIMRDVQTSFAVNLNTAEFNNTLKISANNIHVGVNVGLEGRYEVRGVLMGTNKSGKMQPIAMTMTADWLSHGQQSIGLKLDSKIIAESGLSAPYILRNVQLTNQVYLAPVQSIQAGINISGFAFDRELDLR